MWQFWRKDGVKTEARALFDITWPAALQMLGSNMIPMVNLAIVGQHCSTTEMGAAGLSISFLGVSGISIGWGLATGYDTLGSQAYGNGDHKLVGDLAQRSGVIMTLAMLPITALWINAGQILAGLGFDPIVTQMVARYALLALPTLPGAFLAVVSGKFLQVQQKVQPLVIVGFVSNVVHALLCYLLVGPGDLALDGSAVAFAVANWTAALCTVAVVKLRGIGIECWHGFSAAAMEDLRPYLNLAIPGMFMLCIEWWSFEICQFLAGLLGDVELATQVAIQSVTSVTFMISVGVGIAASVRVGNCLGAGEPAKADLAAQLSIFTNFGIGLGFGVFYVSMRENLVRTFSSDPGVLKIARDAVLVVALFQIADAIQCSCSGVLRGSGHQGLGSVVNLIGYWVVGIPTGAIIAFTTDLGVMGLWIGLCLSLATQATVLVLYVRKINWKREVTLARARMTESSKKEQSVDVSLIDLAARANDDDQSVGDDEALLQFDVTELPMPKSLDSVISDVNPCRRMWIYLLLPMITLVVGVGLRIWLVPFDVCWPLPTISNGTVECGNGHTSAFAGDSCEISCFSRDPAFGELKCTNDGWARADLNTVCLQ